MSERRIRTKWTCKEKSPHPDADTAVKVKGWGFGVPRRALDISRVNAAVDSVLAERKPGRRARAKKRHPKAAVLNALLARLYGPHDGVVHTDRSESDPEGSAGVAR